MCVTDPALHGRNSPAIAHGHFALKVERGSTAREKRLQLIAEQMEMFKDASVGQRPVWSVSPSRPQEPLALP